VGYLGERILKTNFMRITKKSQLSGIEHTMDLDVTTEQMERFNNRRKSGEFIQHIFPDLKPDEREFILTGITSEEWDEAFSEKNN
jgi:hypothetical protein